MFLIIWAFSINSSSPHSSSDWHEFSVAAIYSSKGNFLGFKNFLLLGWQLNGSYQKSTKVLKLRWRRRSASVFPQMLVPPSGKEAHLKSSLERCVADDQGPFLRRQRFENCLLGLLFSFLGKCLSFLSPATKDVPQWHPRSSIFACLCMLWHSEQVMLAGWWGAHLLP